MTTSTKSPSSAAPSSTVASAAETMAVLLADSKRRSGRFPVPRYFMTWNSTPGPFASFVKMGRENALDQYLLLLAMVSSEPYTMERHDERIARALGFTEKAMRESARKLVRTNWRWLRDEGLIEIDKGPDRSTPRITLLAADGSGDKFTPNPGDEGGYYQVPFAYFKDGWHHEMNLRAKAALLICLNNTSSTRGPRFTLPAERAAGWYGISADTFERGTQDLRKKHEVLDVAVRYEKAPRAPSGQTAVNDYQLLAPFETPKKSRKKKTKRKPTKDAPTTAEPPGDTP